MDKSLTQDNKDGIKALLVGRKIVAATRDTLTLDNGKRLRFRGHDGGEVS